MMSSVFLLCLVSGVLIKETWSQSNNAPVIGCPPGWTQLGSRCFIFQNRHVDMATAEGICISLGGNLASVHSNEENLFLRELIYKSYHSYRTTLIGLYDAVKDGTWLWTDGSKFDYAIWGQNEPNNAGGPEDCVEMNWRGGPYWNDVPCRYHFPFVCAKPL